MTSPARSWFCVLLLAVLLLHFVNALPGEEVHWDAKDFLTYDDEQGSDLALAKRDTGKLMNDDEDSKLTDNSGTAEHARILRNKYSYYKGKYKPSYGSQQSAYYSKNRPMEEDGEYGEYGQRYERDLKRKNYEENSDSRRPFYLDKMWRQPIPREDLSKLNPKATGEKKDLKGMNYSNYSDYSDYSDTRRPLYLDETWIQPIPREDLSKVQHPDAPEDRILRSKYSYSDEENEVPSYRDKMKRNYGKKPQRPYGRKKQYSRYKRESEPSRYIDSEDFKKNLYAETMKERSPRNKYSYYRRPHTGAAAYKDTMYDKKNSGDEDYKKPKSSYYKDKMYNEENADEDGNKPMSSYYKDKTYDHEESAGDKKYNKPKSYGRKYKPYSQRRRGYFRYKRDAKPPCMEIKKNTFLCVTQPTNLYETSNDASSYSRYGINRSAGYGSDRFGSRYSGYGRRRIGSRYSGYGRGRSGSRYSGYGRRPYRPTYSGYRRPYW